MDYIWWTWKCRKFRSSLKISKFWTLKCSKIRSFQGTDLKFDMYSKMTLRNKFSFLGQLIWAYFDFSKIWQPHFKRLRDRYGLVRKKIWWPSKLTLGSYISLEITFGCVIIAFECFLMLSKRVGHYVPTPGPIRVKDEKRLK